MLDIWHKLQNFKHIAVYGMGNGGEMLINEMKKYGITPVAVFASDGFVRGQSFLGYTVKRFSEVKTEYPDVVVVIAFGSAREEVLQNILSLDAPVFLPEMPVVDDVVFNSEFLEKNLEKIKNAYELLADERSRKTFEEIIRFRISGELSHLFNAESPRQAVFDCLDVKKGARILDLGAYNGDTATEFFKAFAPREIVAVEPDERNFRKLLANTENMCVTPINAASGESDGTVMFYQSGSRGSRKGGTKEVRQVRGDFLGKFDFIKIDVEGNESQTLKGLYENMKERAKMLVAAYHRPEDIFEIPLYVHSVMPEYKIYLFHERCVPAWDTNYCFI